MIVRITSHPRQAGIVLVHTPPDLAHDVMGPFQPARWSKPAGAYLLGVEHLETFGRHLARHDVRLVDERGAEAGEDREKFTGPLPECANPECRLPATRRAAATMRFCPACGAEWVPSSAAATSGMAPVQSECGSCGRMQAGSFPRCSACGGPMVQVVTGARPAHVPRPKLEHPPLFGEVAEEVIDHMKRAAGDR